MISRDPCEWDIRVHSSEYQNMSHSNEYPTQIRVLLMVHEIRHSKSSSDASCFWSVQFNWFDMIRYLYTFVYKVHNSQRLSVDMICVYSTQSRECRRCVVLSDGNTWKLLARLQVHIWWNRGTADENICPVKQSGGGIMLRLNVWRRKTCSERCSVWRWSKDDTGLPSGYITQNWNAQSKPWQKPTQLWTPVCTET